MTSPRLRMLERQYSKNKTGTHDSDERRESSSLVMDAIEQAVIEQAQVRIDAAKEQQEKAEKEAIELRKEVAKLNRELALANKDMVSKMGTMQAAHKAECERMCAVHAREMQALREENNSLRQEMAGEQQARVRAESQLEAAHKMHMSMEQMVKNIKITAPAPVVQQTAASPKPVTATVSKRDGNGRIVSVTIS